MRISRGASALISVSVLSALLGAAPVFAQEKPPLPPADIPGPAASVPPAQPMPDANTAIDAAQAMASAMDGAGGGISSSGQIAALQAAAAAREK